MSNHLSFELEDLNVSVIYDPSNNSVKRTVTDAGAEIFKDELTFDKSLVASFELKSEEERAKIVTAWGAAGLRTKIEEGQLKARRK